MSLLRVDSFDHYATAEAAKKGWTLGTNVTISAGTGRNGTASLRATNLGATQGRSLLGITNTGRDGVTGFAFRAAALPGVDVGLLLIMEGAVEHLRLVLLTTGAIRVLRAGSITLNTSVSTPIVGATYSYIEFAWNIHDTLGTYDVRVNGVSVVSGTGADTQNAGTGIWNGVQWWGVTTTTTTEEIDDVYVADDTTFRGDHRIVAILPSTGNGTHVGWTPSTGTDHGTLVDENPPNTSDYVSTNTTGVIDTYNFPAVGVAGTVAAVQASYYAKADVAGVRQLAHTAQIGGTNYPATAQTLGNDWLYSLYLSTTSPATAAAWTVAEIDAAEFGPKCAV